MKIFIVKLNGYQYGGGMALVNANSIDEVKELMTKGYKDNWSNDEFRDDEFIITEINGLISNIEIPKIIDQHFYFE